MFGPRQIGCLAGLTFIVIAGFVAIFFFGWTGLGVSGLVKMAASLQGSGNPVTEPRQVEAFTGIEVQDSAYIAVVIGPTTSVSVTTDDNLLPKIETKVVNGTLQISSSGSYSSRLGVKFQVTTPSLQSFSIAGSGKARIDGLKNSTFALSIAGSGDAVVKGTSDDCSVDISGSGSVKAEELLCHNVKVAIAGSGSVTVYADRSLDASITGSGSIGYLGNPAEVKKSILGVGSVKAR